MEPETSEGIRRVLRGILALGLAGSATDLLLIEHYEGVLQLPALGMLAVSAATLIWYAFSGSQSVSPAVDPSERAGSSPVALRMFQGAMLLMVAVGAIGAVLHFRGNMEFQLEVDPSLAGFALIEKVARATAPPLLAPFNMSLLGLVGLASTYRGGRS